MPGKIYDITTKFTIENKGYISPCWIWRGATVKFLHLTYGKLRIGKKFWLTHRYMYEYLIGPIPEGMQLDHLCRMTLCCNPTHMEIVTRSENMRRAYVSKKRKSKSFPQVFHNC